MTKRVRGLVFGECAEDYDRIRPGYPAALVDDVLALAGPGPVLEVGAGTGKATSAFTARGADLTCLEPDPRMAAVLRRAVPGVRVVETTFEDWRPDREYGLVISAQAWHWVDPARRAALAFEALAPGGLLAPFWNVLLVTDRETHAALAAVDARHGLVEDGSGHLLYAGDVPAEPRPFLVEWPELASTAELFTDLRTLRYRSNRTFTSAEYRAYLLSHSLYRMLDDERREAAVTDAVAVTEARGGRIDFTVVTDVVTARRP
jgi:SAM-dependent methyltransferase